MAIVKDQFFIESPTKILEKAEQYSKSIKWVYIALDNRILLPQQISKSMVVKTKAQSTSSWTLDEIENIDFAIKMSEYQQHLFRSKEDTDLEVREKFRSKIDKKDKKIEMNLKELDKKKAKKTEDYEKHVKEVYKRF